MEVLGLLSHDPDLDNILPQKLACAPPVSWGLPRRGHSPGGTEEGGDVSPGGEDDNTTPPSLKSVGRLESQADRTTALLEPTGAPRLMKTPPGELPSQGRRGLDFLFGGTRDTPHRRDRRHHLWWDPGHLRSGVGDAGELKRCALSTGASAAPYTCHIHGPYRMPYVQNDICLIFKFFVEFLKMQVPGETASPCR